jgi:hypothetical protein
MSANREHEHREFCSKKFLDPSYADWMREALASGSDEYAAGGFTNLRHDDTPAGKHWICRACFDDFLTEHHWDVEVSDPGAWPYDPPEPSPRPTADD